MAWWIWIAGAFVIGIVEIVVPGYVFLGFSVGALVVGALAWLGLLSASLPAQLAVFAVVSLIGWLGLRALFPHQRGEVTHWKRDIND